MIANWSVPFTLTTPRGSLPLNAATGDRYLLLNEKCSGGADLRFTSDDMPQADGQLNHRSYLTGYRMRLALGLWDGEEAACGQAAQEMLDELGQHLDALRRDTGTKRIVWTPEGMPARMVNDLDLFERQVVTVVPRDEESIVAVTFGVVSEFPYEMSEAEQTPVLINAGSIPTTLTNDGNTRFWPVFKVYGPTSQFTITNLSVLDDDGNPLEIVYDGSWIGTSEYVEIDAFRGTVFLNGDEDNLLSGIDFTETTFWALEPGANDVTIEGADVDVLYNDAWL